MNAALLQQPCAGLCGQAVRIPARSTGKVTSGFQGFRWAPEGDQQISHRLGLVP